jgi:uncharacterized protein DUF4123
MIQTQGSNPYWLFDASALTPSQVDGLRQLPQVRWLYDHVQEERAALVGPVLVAPCVAADRLAVLLQADDACAWAVATLHTPADFATLAQHLVSARCLHTLDGQRYYLRYADSRCLVALWRVLNPSQRAALLGPVQQWAYTDRQARTQVVSLDREPAAPRSTMSLRLNHQQLADLLQGTWPDQLLHSVAERQPHLGQSLTPWQRYSCARRVCDWLVAAHEDRYPVQVDMLTLCLSNASLGWDEAQWMSSLKASHQACVESCA